MPIVNATRAVHHAHRSVSTAYQVLSRTDEQDEEKKNRRDHRSTSNGLRRYVAVSVAVALIWRCARARVTLESTPRFSRALRA